jgi:Spy/CpxP family protein refolding chaperone
MIKNALLVLFLVVAVAVGVGSPGYAAQDNPATPPGPATMRVGSTDNPSAGPGEFAKPAHHRLTLEAIQKKLGITDDQKKQMRALQVGFQDRTRKTRTDLASLRDEKKTMMLSGKIDQQKLAQIDDQIVKLRSDIMRERLKMWRDRLALLTPEQIGRISDWQAEKGFRARMHMRHGGTMHGGNRRGDLEG